MRFLSIPQDTGSSGSARGKENADGVHLTKRELQVLKCIDEEMSIKQIAFSLKITENTVKYHRKNLYDKLGVHTHVGAIHRRRELGYLD